MSDRAHDDDWRPWRMAPLERRVGPREPDPVPSGGSEDTSPRTRRREDQISMALFELAKEEAEQKGHEAGYDAGYQAGYAAGEAQIRAEQQAHLDAETATRLASIDRLVSAFGDAAAALDERLGRQVVALAIETGRHLAGRALEIQPEHILDDVQELIENHPGLTGSPTLFVAADELALVEHHLGQSILEAGWRLRGDVALAAGDCRIEDDEREIDSSDADRWNRLRQAVGHEEH
ncbi:flagellar assembly protein FliH [Salinisphaera sp. Q1T1-3]|uniref:flagellar assembly protein FliH n=1 Tax=Salinisphaera sp. Q1T1-3 TaxID=2321229 RepID=UPI000E740F15|nr:flagellar assembly protein FliH [Salinisphaera sp. Q1T1-3]RJS95152.1 flagellar assembly protein FliH [Salinisphaera sp. Q1T1-3]